ncbi:hypothetical protein FPOAC2_13989 [Fusarium poae]
MSHPKSPPPTASVVRLEPSPSPPPDISTTRICPNPGDMSLLRFLNGGRNPQIASAAGRESLLCDEESPDEEARGWPANGNPLSGLPLPHLAVGALGAASIATVPKMIPDISIPTDHPGAFSPTTRCVSANRVTSPLIESSIAPLPPLHGVHAPVGESKETLPSQSLPSLRSTFGNLRDLAPGNLPKQEVGRIPSGLSSTFFTSPAGSTGHRFNESNLSSSLDSPPENYRELPPHSAQSTSIHYYTTDATHPRAPTEYSSSSSSSNAAEAPSIDHSVLTPANSTSINSTSITDRMSLDGTTHSQHISDPYTCTVPGCNASPFRTQYLLNSHMNVHSPRRPHYCSVKGCLRSEGGTGFKRKNELKRHGLVHETPGYKCPYCPYAERNYPRPDGLQRHVRVYHQDIGKDDPQLREVLAQRPGGLTRPRKGRRAPS